MQAKDKINKHIKSYIDRLSDIINNSNWEKVATLAHDLFNCWKSGGHVYICGNGGSAGNATHLANDFLYGIAKITGQGMKISSLSANSAVITCLGNDTGYENIYSEQLAVLANDNDLLIVLSGSGNSKNIINVVNQAKRMNIKSFAILGFTGGEVKNIVDEAIHFEIDDMQISEDLQLIIGHMLMQWLYQNRKLNKDEYQNNV
jgi:D-sedoheptulose 7-phosphate isomerase